jgi:predicted GTPase
MVHLDYIDRDPAIDVAEAVLNENAIKQAVLLYSNVATVRAGILTPNTVVEIWSLLFMFGVAFIILQTPSIEPP